MDNAKIQLLVIEAQQGSSDAFSALCQYFYPRILKFAIKLSSDEQLAHDATQNAFLKVAKSIRRLQDPKAFKSWLYQAVRWQVIDMAKGGSKRTELQCETDIENIAITEPCDSTSDLQEQINKLPDIDKQVIHLFYLESMTIQEISLILTTPQGTIKSRLNRARNTLKKHLIHH